MKLKAKVVPYSSVVGGGLMLCTPKGRVLFMVSLRGSTQGITKEENDQITQQLAAMINRDGIEVTERSDAP